MDFGKKYQLRCALRHDDDEVCGIAICGNTGKIVTSSDRMIRLWTVHGEDLSKTSFDTPASTVRCISWIPPNPTLKSGGVSGCVNNAVVVWDVDSGKIVKTLDHESEVTGIVVDGDDLVSSSIDGNLKRWSNWNCSNCTETWAAHEGPIQAVIKLPTGELVTGSSPILGSRDSSLKIWKGKVCLHTFHGHAFHGHADTVCGLAAMSDFGILSVSHDGSLRLWALNGHQIMNMSGHTATVCSVDSHASGLIVSGSEDRLAKIWKDLSCVQSLEHPRSVRDTKFTENGDIVTACSDGLVRIWTPDQNHFASQEELESKLKKRKLNDIDEVADGSEESNRPSFDGVQQDAVPVVIDGKTLQYNRSVNVYAAAGQWLTENSEPFQRLLTIKDTILEVTGQKDNIFDASITHQTSSDIASHFKFEYLPKQEANVYNSIDYEVNRANIVDHKEKLLSDLEIATMENIYRRLESQDDNASVFQASEIDLLLKMLSSWPRSRISHVIDITRMTVLYDSGANLLMTKIDPYIYPGNDALMKVIKSSSQMKENLLANIRAVTNLFSSSWCFDWLQKNRIEILSSFSSWHLPGDICLHDAYSVLILNYAVLLIESSSSNQDGLYHILFAALEASAIPVVLIENSGRCNKNETDEKVLPNGIAWIPHLVQTITEIALNKSESIFVDKNLIEGPNPNQRGKIWIPVIFALQFLVFMKPIEALIKNDIANEKKPSWETRDVGVQKETREGGQKDTRKEKRGAGFRR